MRVWTTIPEPQFATVPKYLPNGKVLDFLCKQAFIWHQKRKGQNHKYMFDTTAAWMYDHLNAKIGIEPSAEVRERLNGLAEIDFNETNRRRDMIEVMKKHYLQHYFDELIAAGKELEL